jgi:hypothetical protein
MMNKHILIIKLSEAITELAQDELYDDLTPEQEESLRKLIEVIKREL